MDLDYVAALSCWNNHWFTLGSAHISGQASTNALSATGSKVTNSVTQARRTRASSSGAFSHSARTAPIITLFIPETPLKTTHLQKRA